MANKMTVKTFVELETLCRVSLVNDHKYRNRPSTMTPSKRLKLSKKLFALPLLLSLNCAHSEIEEKTVYVPVSLLDHHQQKMTKELVVDVVYDTEKKHSMMALIAHGRAVSAQERQRMGQVQYPGNSRWLADQGFMVIVPTRIGYGSTGGPDLDYSGECDHKDYLSAIQFGTNEYRQILNYFRQQNHYPKNVIVIGESYGGMLAISLASGVRDTGVVGVVNIAGGDGGDSSHTDEPCEPEKLKATFSYLGKQTEVPTYWMYSLNDRFWGAHYPQQWFNAFIENVGKGTFVQLPADKNNGHFIFNRNVLAWHGEFEKFISHIKGATTANSTATPR